MYIETQLTLDSSHVTDPKGSNPSDYIYLPHMRTSVPPQGYFSEFNIFGGFIYTSESGDWYVGGREFGYCVLCCAVCVALCCKDCHLTPFSLTLNHPSSVSPHLHAGQMALTGLPYSLPSHSPARALLKGTHTSHTYAIHVTVPAI